jgi:LmbE family N-acetylglucosaminyl deacetylase
LPTSPSKTILAVGAHPDDIEFGCGGVLIAERQRGFSIVWAVCSRGEAGTHGTPELRQQECESAAQLCNAQLIWLEMGGDAHLQDRFENALALAQVIRQVQPQVVLAPSLPANQHPDHSVVGQLVRKAARLARYGGLKELSEQAPHAIEVLLFYRITPGATPQGLTEIAVDISPVVGSWEAMMRCHQSQLKTRDYVELQLTASRLAGLQFGRTHAQMLYSEEALMVDGLRSLDAAQRQF